MADLKAHSVFASRTVQKGARVPIATLGELVAAGIKIHENPNEAQPNAHGIPQGTPISASMSNLYMVEFDRKLQVEIATRGPLYQRYSDDMLIACCPDQADDLEGVVMAALGEEGLEVQDEKTDRCMLTGGQRNDFQYLGYHIGYGDAQVRSGSLSKQWRSAKRTLLKAEREGRKRIDGGEAEKIYTRKLRSKLTHVGSRNFIAYIIRPADELESEVMKMQVKRLHRFGLTSIDGIKGLKP